MHEHAISKAETGEQLVWNRLIRNPEDKSCTLSYRFLINKTVSLEEINEAMYGFLRHHKALNYRFYEHEGILYKRWQQPSLAPVNEINETFPVRKILFTEALNPLYFFQWQAREEGGYLYVHLSHLIIDGSGFALLVKELEAALLHHPKRSEGSQTMPQFSNEYKDDDYWRNYLQEQSLYQPVPFLEQYEPRELVHYEQLISQEVVQQLSEYKKNNKTTLFHLLSTALAITLHQYLKDEDAETTIKLAYYVNANKHRAGFGCAINLLPLFIPCHDDDTLASILQRVISTRAEQRSRQNLSIIDLLNYLEPVKNNNLPLMNVVINESPGLLAQANPAFFAEATGIENHSAATTLSLIYAFDGETLKVRFESNQQAALYGLLGQFGCNFEKALKHLLTQPQTKLKSVLFRASMEPVSHGAYIVHEQDAWHIFAEQMQNHSSRIAIRDERNTLSYKNLDSALSSVYACLAAQDQAPLSKGVALFLTRSVMLPVAMLSAIAARVTFIPIAENLSETARRSIIDETQLNIVLVDNQSEQLLTAAEKAMLQVINLETLPQPLENIPSFSPLVQNDTAYILFTSGSTGKPKGVMITYENLTNFLYSIATNPGFTLHDTLLAITSISFDIAINELLLPLFCGGTVFVAANHVRACHKSLGDLLDQNNMTVLQATPSTLSLLMQSNWHWPNKSKLRLWIGGEALTEDLVRFFKQQNIDIYNMYGPTETTIWVSASLIQSTECLSIGTPLANTSLYVLNNQGEALPLGMPGELVIEGQLVGEGYINHPVTSFKQTNEGVKRYHTGDKVMALARNTVIYLKRYDDQIKLRGYRIELEEINTQLRTVIPQFIGLTLAVEHPEPHLCVYYTAPADLNIPQVNKQLKKVLPEYKVPQSYRLLKTMPLNNSGKVDRKKLVAGEFEALSDPQNSYQDLPPESGAIEQRIGQLILKHFAITIGDLESSLLDYGFNSLSFNHLSTLCEQELGFTINSHQFYHLNTIKKLADYYRSNSLSIAAPSLELERQFTHIPIAIIGYDALLPGSKNPNQFWDALINQECLISENKRSWLNSDERAGYLNDIEYFDRKFFNLSPIEVMHLDFRQRLLLQCAFRAIEHACTPAEQLAQKRVACFIAATGMDSLLVSAKQEFPAHPYSLSGNSLSMLANRLSFYFNWQGPSVTVDTACSGSLAALARAVECLTLGKAELCFVGSANLIVDDEFINALRAGRFLSPQYHCASFSDQADGYVRGEGIFGFLLKPLEQAKRDGDTIHAVIHQVAENHGGRTASLTSPSQQAQTALLHAAYTPSLLEQLSYIETHGTGTKLGDPIEIDALKEFEKLALGANQHSAIYLGALKQNIGHLEASAGFASLLKVILAMKHQCLPANPYRYGLNSLISFEHSKLKLLTETVTWNNKSPIAGVSSFGFGGSNVHVVLAGYKDTRVTDHSERNLPFLLSAKTMTALRGRIKSLLDDLRTDFSLNDIAYSLAMGRTYFECRTAVVAKTRQALYEKLTALLSLDDLGVAIQDKEPGFFLSELENYLAGGNEDWSTVFKSLHCKRIALSPYVFDAEFCLHERYPQFGIKPVDLMEELSWSEINARQQKILFTQNHPFLAQHQVYNNKVLPGVSYIDLLLKLLGQHSSEQTFICLENICWLQPAICRGDVLTLVLERIVKSDSVSFQFYNSDNQILATGEYIQLKRDYTSLYSWFDEAKESLKQTGLDKVTTEVIYKKFSQLGLDYGPYFQGISSVSLYKNMALTTLSINPQGSCTALLDAAFQSGMAINLSEIQAGLMPFSLGKMIIFNTNKLRSMYKSNVYTLKNSPFRTNFIICDEDEQPVVALIDLGVKPTLLK